MDSINTCNYRLSLKGSKTDHLKETQTENKHMALKNNTSLDIKNSIMSHSFMSFRL